MSKKIYTTATKAITDFLAVGENEITKVRAKELKEFKTACSPTEWVNFGHQAASILNAELNI